MSTGHFDLRITFSATLPVINLERPVLPCEPITIKSVWKALRTPGFHLPEPPSNSDAHRRHRYTAQSSPIAL